MAKQFQSHDRKVTGADVIAFIEECLFVPEGQHVAKPLALQSWQKDWIRRLYDNPAGSRRGDPEHAAEGRKDCALCRAPACPPVRSACPQQAEQPTLLGRAEP